METFYTDNQTYVATKAQLVDIEQSLAAAPGNSFTVTSSSATSYALSVQSKTGNTSAIAKATDGSVTRSCSRTGGTTRGGCPASNSW